MKKTLIIALFVAALVMSACGAGSPEAEVKATFEKFVDALKKAILQP